MSRMVEFFTEVDSIRDFDLISDLPDFYPRLVTSKRVYRSGKNPSYRDTDDVTTLFNVTSLSN